MKNNLVEIVQRLQSIADTVGTLVNKMLDDVTESELKPYEQWPVGGWVQDAAGNISMVTDFTAGVVNIVDLAGDTLEYFDASLDTLVLFRRPEVVCTGDLIQDKDGHMFTASDWYVANRDHADIDFVIPVEALVKFRQYASKKNL